MTLNISSGYKKENSYMLPERNGKERRVSFRGQELGNMAAATANYLGALVQTNELVGPTVVDIVSMVIPRTWIDSTRGKDAGIETFARETTGYSTNCIIPGFVAMGVGYILGKIRKSPINTSLATESSTAEMLHKSWAEASNDKAPENAEHKAKIIEDYIKNVFNKAEGLVGLHDEGLEKQGWLKFKEKFEEFSKNIEADNVENKEKNIFQKLGELITGDKNASGKDLKGIKDEFVHILGASENIRIETEGGTEIRTTAKRLINETYNIGRKVFSKLEEPARIDAAIKELTRVSEIKSFLALGLVTCFGFSLQFVNRHLTKKRTGSSAFVGLSKSYREQEDSENKNKKPKTKFYIAKALCVAGILNIAAVTIADTFKPKEIIKTFGNRKNLLKKLEFNSKWTHLNQLRTIYALMIVGRLLASADKHELRETGLRDIPGFLNWLVLGGFVAKGVGRYVSNGKLINAAEKYPGKDAPFLTRARHFLVNQSLMSHAEIKERKLSLKQAEEILIRTGQEILPQHTEQTIIENAKKMMNKQLNLSIFAGLAYSTVMLGTLMPWFNKKITNALTSNKKHPKNQVTIQNPIENSLNNEIFADFIKIRQNLQKA